MSKKRKYTDNDLIKYIQNSISFRELMFSLGLKYGGGSFSQVKKDVERLGLSTSHFKGQGHGKNKGKRFAKKKPLNKILRKNSNVGRTNLKRRLIEEGILINHCYECGLKREWNGKKIVMVLDHINGINNDYRIENLRMLCPNCNSQMETFAGRNQRRTPKVFCKKCSTEIKKNKTGLCTTCFHAKRGSKYLCEKCGKGISRRSQSNMCGSCSQRTNVGRCKRPSKKKLMEEVNDVGFSATGRKYGVSDNSIRKWLK